ncbi:hypothetical protein TNCV_498781 [Trichonephila clavipes]|nr:hypothetical protein TNCV_498781 [Trichonephila clavipes]
MIRITQRSNAFSAVFSEKPGISDKMSTGYKRGPSSMCLGLPPNTIITPSVKRWQSVELVCAIFKGKVRDLHLRRIQGKAVATTVSMMRGPQHVSSKNRKVLRA